MVGIAVGDALGRPVEGHRDVSPGYIDEITTRPRSLTYSDDAAMSIWLTESLLACGGFDGADMARRFADGYFAEPYRGYGGNIVHVFQRVSRGMDWRTAATIQFEGSGSYGNGGAMRVAPVAVWAYPDMEETIRLARETAEVTDTHPIGVEGAVIQAVAAHHALAGDFTPNRLLADLDRLVETDEFGSTLEMLGRALDRGDDEYARLHLGNWVGVHNSVLTAVYCFLFSDGFADTVVRAIRLGRGHRHDRSDVWSTGRRPLRVVSSPRGVASGRGLRQDGHLGRPDPRNTVRGIGRHMNTTGSSSQSPTDICSDGDRASNREARSEGSSSWCALVSSRASLPAPSPSPRQTAMTTARPARSTCWG